MIKQIKHAISSSQSSVYSWWGSIQSIADLNPDIKESLDIEIMKSTENKEQRYVFFLQDVAIFHQSRRGHMFPLSHLQSQMRLIDFKHYEAPKLQTYTKINTTCATCTQDFDFTLPKCGCTPSSAAAGEQEGVILQEPVLLRKSIPLWCWISQ